MEQIARRMLQMLKSELTGAFGAAAMSACVNRALNGLKGELKK